MPETILSLPGERWKDIPNAPGYSASNLGRIKNHTSLLNQKLNPAGYYYVYFNGKTRIVHVLVTLAFYGPKPPHYHTHHMDQKKTNNCLHNLIYVHTKDHITYHPEKVDHFLRIGEDNCNAKLCDADVVLIRRLNKAGWKYKELADEFGVIWNTIRKVCKNQIWKHV